MSSFTQPAQFIGVTAALIQCGTHFGATALTIPAILGRAPNVSASAFAIVFHRGTTAVSTFAVISSLSFAYLAYQTPSQRYLYTLAALGPIAVGPFTAVVMKGGIDKLLAVAEGQVSSKETVDALLNVWGKQNLFRAALPFIGGATGLLAIMGSKLNQ